MASKKKRKPIPSSGEVADGIVIRSTGRYSLVQVEEGGVYKCVVRGKMRLADLKTTNPVAVGDKVCIQLPSEPEELGAIREVLPRKNYILRKAASHQHIVHVLCANVDQAILLYTVSQPHTTSGFANRFLVVAEAYHIPVQILINKVDVLETEEEKFKLAEVTYMYESIGYPVMALSARDPRYREQVQALLQDKVSFISGHSGAGKSTLINLVDPSLDLKTGDISAYYSKGRHTTTYAEMHALSFGGFIIDSPGIKEMGIAGFEKEELAHYFPEMRALMPECRFSNCLHLNEPGCAVKQALETGGVHHSRYNSYLSMIEEMEEGK